MKVTVALLTKNGGTRLKECVRAIGAQRMRYDVELLAIDSGSRDGTYEALKAIRRAKVVAIRPEEFQHGRTRNLAMQIASGELVVFITQDAVPESEAWLAQFVDFMDEHPEVAGAFGHQVAQPGASPLEAWEIGRHFDSFKSGPFLFRAGGDHATDTGDQSAARSHFFSNVNSCIRRTAWQQIPFPEIDFGEDQAWASEVHRAGYATGYVEGAVVRHSHDYGVLSLLRRRYDESRFMRRRFGYALVPSWRQALAVGRRQSATYLAFMAQHPSQFTRRSRWPAYSRAWATSFGWFLGTQLAKGNGLVHRCISLTERDRRA